MSFDRNNLERVVKSVNEESLIETKGVVEWVASQFESEEFKSNFSEDELNNISEVMGKFSDEVLVVYITSELVKGE